MAYDYYPGKSIGEMLMEGGLAAGHLMQQKRARDAQNLVAALGLMGSLNKFPQSIRENQEALKGIDEALSQMTGGKLKLPKATEQSLGEIMKAKTAGMEPTAGGMTPLGEAAKMPEPGQYLPIGGNMKKIYSMAGGRPKVTGEIEEGAMIDPMDQLVRSEALATKRFELGEQSAEARAQRQSQRDIERDERIANRQERLARLNKDLQKEYYDYTKKGDASSLTGANKIAVDFLKLIGEQPEGQNWTYTINQLRKAGEVYHQDKDAQALIDNKAAEYAIRDTPKMRANDWDTMSMIERQAAIKETKDMYIQQFTTPRSGWGPRTDKDKGGAAGDWMPEMPDAKKHPNKKIVDRQGKTYKSINGQWVPQ